MPTPISRSLNGQISSSPPSIISVMQRSGATKCLRLERGFVYTPTIQGNSLEYQPIAFSPQLFNVGKTQIHSYDQFGYLLSATSISTGYDANFPKQELPSILDLNYYFQIVQTTPLKKSSPTLYSFKDGVNYLHTLPPNYSTQPLYRQVLDQQPIIKYIGKDI